MSDTTTKPEAWPIRRNDSYGPKHEVLCNGPDQPGERFRTMETAEAFARTPIIQWERDQLLRTLDQIYEIDELPVSARTRIDEVLKQIEGGDR